jgi:hypothetical protein
MREAKSLKREDASSLKEPFRSRKALEELGKGGKAFWRKSSRFSTTVRRIT